MRYFSPWLRLFCISSVLATPAVAAPGIGATVDRLSSQVARMEARLQQMETQKGSPTQAANLQVEMDALREEMSNMRGRIEQVEYSQKQLAETMNRLEKDVDARLGLLEQNAVSGAAPVIGDEMGGAPVIDDEAADEAFAAPVIEEEVTVEEPTPEPTRETETTPVVEESVPEEPQTPVVLDEPGDLTQQAGELPPSPFPSSREQYNAAFTALNQGSFAEAENLFRDFTRRYPDSSLIGNAWYWLGESYYARSQYDDAIRQFRQGFQIMPKGPKAPDNLLKMGMALARTDQTAEACTVFKQLLTNYAQFSSVVKQTALKEQAKLNCQ
tara:strand:- start:304 stop:1284 length:981 start_codon:yes stop_codon:yes gene_type:complete